MNGFRQVLKADSKSLREGQDVVRGDLEDFFQKTLQHSLGELRILIRQDVSSLLQATSKCTRPLQVSNKFDTSTRKPVITVTQEALGGHNTSGDREEASEFLDINDENMHIELTRLLPRPRWLEQFPKNCVAETENARDVSFPVRPARQYGNRLLGKEFVNNTSFNVISTSLLVANACLIGVHTDYRARQQNFGKTEPAAFRYLDVTFCVMFTLELLLRIFASGWEFFHSSDCHWNIFDLIVVVMQLSDEFLEALLVDLHGIQWLRVLRLLRLLRIARVLRLVRFLAELRAMIASLLASLKTAVWAIVLLIMVVYIFAVFFTEATIDYRTQPDASVDDLNGLDKFFGSLSLTMATLYQSILNGLSWGEATQYLRGVSFFLEPAYMLFNAFCLLAIMNAITGVFVDQAMKQTHEENDSTTAEQVIDMINQSGLANDGFLTLDKFLVLDQGKEMKDMLAYIDGDLTDPAALFRLIDLNDSGVVTPNEIAIGCRRLRGAARAIDLALMMREQTDISYQLALIHEKISGLSDVQGAESELGAWSTERSSQGPRSGQYFRHISE